MAGKPPARDEDSVAPQCQTRRPWVAHEPNARGSGDSPPLGRADRDRRDFQIGPRFDFDKAIESPRLATRSISPPETTNRRARIV